MLMDSTFGAQAGEDSFPPLSSRLVVVVGAGSRSEIASPCRTPAPDDQGDPTAAVSGEPEGMPSGSPLSASSRCRVLRASGVKVGALTNNWAADPLPDEVDEVARQAEHELFVGLFDAFIER